jgi:hypothetical protein
MHQQVQEAARPVFVAGNDKIALEVNGIKTGSGQENVPAWLTLRVQWHLLQHIAQPV